MTAFEVFTISGYFQWAGSLIIAINCLPYFKKRPIYIQALALYAVTSICFSLAQESSEWFFGKIGVNQIGNVWTLMEALCFSLLFYYVTDNGVFRKRIVIFLSLCTIFYITTFLFFIDNFHSLIRFGRDALMITYALAYFYYLIRKLPDENLLESPMFWINAAIIFFFSGTFVLSLMLDYLIQVLKNDLATFWAFRNFFRFGFCLVLAYAGWLNWRSIKIKSI
jgi:hypothetical protein